MKPYPAYKDTGIEWLPQIPAHWIMSKVKYEFDNLDFKRIPLSAEIRGAMKDRVYEYYGASGVIDKVEDFIFDEQLILLGEDGANLVMRSKPLAFLADGKYWVNNHAHILKPRKGNIQYLVNILETVDYFPLVSGAAQPKLTAENLGNVDIPIPPNAEQQVIASYINCKAAQIDTLIEKKQRQIALLQEQRTALINHAVTKGLNPNLAMKDSGVEWLGKIPSHWSLPQIRHISKVVRGQTPRPAGDPRFFNGNFIPWITVGEVTKSLGMYLTNTRTMLTEEGSQNSIIFEKGTFVLTNSGATLGVPKILGITGCMNDGVAAFMNIRDDMAKSFMYFFFLTMTEILKEQAQISGQPNLNTTVISEIRIPKPSLDEQEKIVDFLIEQDVKFDVAVKKCLKTIELLQEYRTALISEAVTGKIDVREWRKKKT
jgi:type I restriction enzyme, S subunit